MSHIFDRIINGNFLNAALKGMLGDSMQEMRTINLEGQEEEVNIGDLLDQSKTKRKNRYTIKELSQWNIFDWELELQLAPEFEDVREKIQDCQTELHRLPRDDYEKNLEISLQKIQKKALDILRKKTEAAPGYFFQALDGSAKNLAKDQDHIPGLEVVVEAIGIKRDTQAMIFQLSGIFNKTTARQILPLMEQFLDITQPFVILDLTRLEWIEKAALKSLIEIGERLRDFQGALSLILVDGDFRKQVRNFDEELGEALFLDRGGAVGFFADLS